MRNSFYQELIAQLVAYHCVDEEGKEMMKRLSKLQDIKYQTYLKAEYDYLRESVDDLFRLILSVEYKNITNIKSSEDLKTAIGRTILKPKKDIVDEFIFS